MPLIEDLRQTQYKREQLWVLEYKNQQTNSWKTRFCLLSHDKTDIYMLSENKHIITKLKPVTTEKSYLKSTKPSYKEDLYIKPLLEEVSELVSPIALADDGKIKQHILKKPVLSHTELMHFEQVLNKDYVDSNEQSM